MGLAPLTLGGEARAGEGGLSIAIPTFRPSPKEYSDPSLTARGRAAETPDFPCTLNPGAAALGLVAWVMTYLWVSQRPVAISVDHDPSRGVCQRRRSGVRARA
ncbi:hypothetical protein P7K49_006952, partial [Saguinus oedipus]